MNNHVRCLSLERVVGLNSKTNNSVTYSVENDLFVYSSGNVAVGYSPAQQEQTMFYQTPYKINCLKFSPNSRFLAVGTVGHGGGSICIFDSESGRLIKTWRRKHRFGVACLDWSPDSKFLLTVGHRYDATVRVWNVEKDTTIASNNTTKRKIHNCSFSVDGKTFVTAGEGHFKFWRFSETSRVVTGRKCVLNELSDCCFSDVDNDKIRSNIFYSVTSNGRLCSFDNRSRTIKRCIELNTSSASSVYNDKDLLVVGCGNGLIRIFRTNELKYIATVPAIPSINRIYGVEGFDHKMEDEYLKTLCTVSVKLSVSKKTVFSVYSDKSIYEWDISNLEDIKVKKSYLSHAGCIWDVDQFPFQKKQTILPNNSIVTVGSDNTIRFWNFSSSDEEIRSLKSIARRNFFSHDMIYGKEITPFSLSTTKSSIASSCGKKSNTKNIGSISSSSSKKNIGGSEKTNHHGSSFGKDEELRCIKFSPRGEFFVVGDRSGVIRVFESVKFREIKSYQAHDSEVLSIDFQYHDHHTSSSPRGDLSQSYSSWDFANNLVPYLIVTGSRDRNINIYTFRPRKKVVLRHLLTLSDHTSTVTSVILTKKCRRLFSCSGDKTAIFRNIVKISDEVIQAHDYARSSFNSTLYDMVKVNNNNRKKNCVVVAGNHSLRLISSDTGKEIFTFESSSSSSQSFLNNNNNNNDNNTNKRKTKKKKKIKNIMKKSVIEEEENEDKSTGIKSKKNQRFSSPITIMDSSNTKTMKIITTPRRKKMSSSSSSLSPISSTSSSSSSTQTKTNPYKVSVNGSGNLIAVSYTDRSIRLYELKRGTFLMKITSHSELVTGMCFTSDEKHLITMSLDGCMFIWRFSHPHVEYGKKIDHPDQIVMNKPKLVLPKSMSEKKKSSSSSSRKKNNNIFNTSSSSTVTSKNIYSRNRKRLFLQQHNYHRRKRNVKKKRSIIEPMIIENYNNNNNNTEEDDKEDNIPLLIPKLSLRLEKLMNNNTNNINNNTNKLTFSSTSSTKRRGNNKWRQKKQKILLLKKKNNIQSQQQSNKNKNKKKKKSHFPSKNQLQFDTNKLPTWLQKRKGKNKKRIVKRRTRNKKIIKNINDNDNNRFVIPKIPPFFSNDDTNNEINIINNKLQLQLQQQQQQEEERKKKKELLKEEERLFDNDDELEEFGSRILNEENNNLSSSISSPSSSSLIRSNQSHIKEIFGNDFNIHEDGTQTARFLNRRRRTKRRINSSPSTSTSTTTTTTTTDNKEDGDDDLLLLKNNNNRKWNTKKKSFTPLVLQSSSSNNNSPPSVEDYFSEYDNIKKSNGNSSYTIDDDEQEEEEEQQKKVNRKLFGDNDIIGKKIKKQKNTTTNNNEEDEEDESSISLTPTTSQNYIDSVRKMIEDLDKHEDIVTNDISDDENDDKEKKIEKKKELVIITTNKTTTTVKKKKKEEEQEEEDEDSFSSSSSSDDDDDDDDISSLSEIEEEEEEEENEGKKKKKKKKKKSFEVVENGILMKDNNSPNGQTKKVFIPRINLSMIGVNKKDKNIIDKLKKVEEEEEVKKVINEDQKIVKDEEEEEEDDDDEDDDDIEENNNNNNNKKISKKTNVINRRYFQKKKNKKKKKKNMKNTKKNMKQKKKVISSSLMMKKKKSKTLSLLKKKHQKRSSNIIMDPKKVLDEGDTRKLCVLFCQVVDKLLVKYDSEKKKNTEEEEEEDILKITKNHEEEEEEEKRRRRRNDNVVELETIQRLFEAYSRKLLDRKLIHIPTKEVVKKPATRENGNQTEKKRKEDRECQTMEKKIRHVGSDTSDLGSYINISMEERMDQNQLRISLDRYSQMMMESMLMKLDQREKNIGSSKKKSSGSTRRRSSASSKSSEKKKKRDRDSMK